MSLAVICCHISVLWGNTAYCVKLSGEHLSRCMYVSFGQGSSLLWTHTLRPLYSRSIALTQEGRSQVDDVCECMRD